MWARLRRLLGRNNGEHGETRERHKEADLQSQDRTWSNKWFWGRQTAETNEKAPSLLSTFFEQEQQTKEVEKLMIQLHHMACEINELRGILANYTNKDVNNRLNFELEMLKMQHNQVMSDLQKLPMEMSDALDKCEGLIEENESYIYVHSIVQRYLTQLKNNVHVLGLENRMLWEEQMALQESCEEVKRLYKETHEKICDLHAEQNQPK